MKYEIYLTSDDEGFEKVSIKFKPENATEKIALVNLKEYVELYNKKNVYKLSLIRKYAKPAAFSKDFDVVRDYPFSEPRHANMYFHKYVPKPEKVAELQNKLELLEAALVPDEGKRNECFAENNWNHLIHLMEHPPVFIEDANDNSVTMQLSNCYSKIRQINSIILKRSIETFFKFISLEVAATQLDAIVENYATEKIGSHDVNQIDLAPMKRNLK